MTIQKKQDNQRMKNEKIKKNVFFLQKNDEKSTELIQFFSNSFYFMCIRRYDVYSIDLNSINGQKMIKNTFFWGSLDLKFLN